MTAAMLASIVTALAALCTALGTWLKSRASFTNELTRIAQQRAETKQERDHKFDQHDLELANLRKDLTHTDSNVARLERDLTTNTNGLRDDIKEFKSETTAKIAGLEVRMDSKFSESNRVLTDRFLELTRNISELNGKMDIQLKHMQS